MTGDLSAILCQQHIKTACAFNMKQCEIACERHVLVGSVAFIIAVLVKFQLFDTNPVSQNALAFNFNENYFKCLMRADALR